MAQEEFQHFEVPQSGYSGTDTFIAGDLWNGYIIHVPLGHELEYSFQALDGAKISVDLVPGDSPSIYSESYSAFSSSGEVSSYSAVLPANHGFDMDYTILVVSSSADDVQYTVDIRFVEENRDYTIYYILIILGFVGIVVFSWKLVNWQEKREREANKKSKMKRRR